jgi:hypothetical protein
LDVLAELLSKYTSKHPQLIDVLVIGIWNVDYLKKAKQLFPNHKLCFIGISLPAARTHFLDNVDCLSLPFAALAGQEGQDFIKQAHALNKRVFTWTINDPLQMKTCVLWKVDGVVGDNVPVMLENVQALPKSLADDTDYQKYIQTDTYLDSKRRRVYYYMLTKMMNLASWKIIGV